MRRRPTLPVSAVRNDRFFARRPFACRLLAALLFLSTINPPASATSIAAAADVASLSESVSASVLQGTVTDRDTGQPLAGAKVFLHGSTNAAVAAVTDVNGFYAIDGNLVSNTSGAITFQAAGHYAVATSYNITTVPTTLDLSLLGASTPIVQGTVSDAGSGQPVAGALVFFECNAQMVNGCNISASTDSAGAYAFDASLFFESAAAGFQSRLRASKSGYFQWAGPFQSYSTPYPMTQDVALLSSTGTVLQGTVTDRDTAQPLAGAKIYLHGSTNAAVAAVTDANGVYTLDGALVSNASGSITFQAQDHFAIATSYNITSAPATLDISLLAAATPIVRGTIRDAATTQPVADAFVFFDCNAQMVNGCNISTQSDQTGSYAFDASLFFESAATGFTATLRVAKSGYFQSAGPFQTYAPPFPATQDATLLPSVGTVLHGTITDRDTAQPLAGARVYLHSSTNSAVAAVTDATGAYSINGSQVAGTSGPITFQASGHYAIATTYNITAVPTTLDATLLAVATPIVRGTVRDAATALPVAFATVYFDCNSQMVSGCNIATQTDLSGAYSFDASQFFESAVTGFQTRLRAFAPAYFAFDAAPATYAPPYPITQDVNLLWNGTTRDFTIFTNPPNLTINVDGSDYAAPHTFTWIPGSPHTVSVASPQNGPPGTQYLFESWSDGGAQTHAMGALPFDSTLTAHFNVVTLPPPSDRIEGHVRDANTNAPLDSVTVQAHDATGAFVAATVTDGTGSYTFDTLLPGTYFLRTFADISHRDELWNSIDCSPTCDVTTGTPIVVTSAGVVITADFTLATADRISGRVTDASTGAPLANVIVWVYSASGGFINGLTTLPDGSYSSTPLQAGTYYLVTANGQGYFNELSGNIRCLWNSCDVLTGAPVVVVTGQTTNNIDFALDKGGSIAATVTDAATGQPIDGITVEVLDENGTWLFGMGTDGNGAVQSTGLPSGRYRVRTNNVRGYVDELFDDIVCIGYCNPTAGNLVTVTEPQVNSSVTFALVRGGQIAGSVRDAGTGAPLTDTFVEIYNDQGQWVTSSWLDNQGNYTTTGLLAGTYYARTQNRVGYKDQLYSGHLCVAGMCDVLTGTPIVVTVGQVASNRDFALVQGAQLRGVVVSATTGLELGNITIGITDAVGNFVALAFTDATGRYATTGLNAGTYYARTFSQDYADQLYDGIVCDEFNCDVTAGTPIVVSDPEVRAGINFVLTRGSRLSGHVTDALTGAPIANAPVQALREIALGFATHFAFTDANGFYSFDKLAAGNYRVRASSNGQHVDELYNNVPCNNCDPTIGNVIAVAAESVVSDIDFALDPVSRISGTVTNAATGALLGGVSVHFYNAGGMITASTLTATDGHYESPALPPGAYYVGTFNMQGFFDELYDNIACPPGCIVTTGTAINVAPGALVTANFALNPGGRVHGRVIDATTSAGLASVAVLLYGAAGTFVTSAFTDPSGNYVTTTPLTPGNYFVQAAPFGQLYLGQLYNGIPCAPFCNPITGNAVAVQAGASASVDFALMPAGRITGSVNRADGTPLVNARVGILDAAGHFVTAVFTDPAGSYGSFLALPPGTYFLRASLDPSFVHEVYSEITCIDCNTLSGTPVVVNAGATTPNINFTLEAGQSVRGRVTNAATLAGLADISVEIFDAAGTPITSTWTDPSGNYAVPVPLPPGTYFARTASDGSFVDVLYNQIACLFGDCTPTAGTPIQLTAGAPPLTLNFALEELGSISGTVVESGTGAPLPDTEVSIVSVTGAIITETDTDANGSYRARGLPDGRYYAVATHTAYQQQLYDHSPFACFDLDCVVAGTAGGTEIVIANRQPVQNIDFSLTPGGRISGRMTDAETGNPLADIAAQIYSTAGVPVAIAETDPSGNYMTFPGLAAGSYYLRTSNASGYLNQLFNGVTCPLCPFGWATPIVVTANGATPNIDLVLTKGGRIAGTVTATDTNLPLADVRVVIANAQGYVTEAMTDDAGHYLSDAGLPAGWYNVYTNNTAGYHDLLHADLPCDLGCNPTSGRPVEVTLGNTTTGVDFALPLGGRIGGRVRDAQTGMPLREIVVEVYDASAKLVATGRSDDAGRFVTSPGLDSGTYYARPRDARGYQSMPTGPGISVVSPALTDNIDFALTPVAVVAPDQTPPLITAADLFVEATSANGAIVSFDQVIVTDNTDPAPVVTFNPAPGTPFAIGATTVIVTATDASGNTSSESFDVTVQDTTPPSIVITEPAANATYIQDQFVPASYLCADAVGVSSCVGPVPNGDAIDTSTVGPHTFTVTAIDTAGHVSSLPVTYSVVPLPTIVVNSPVDVIYDLGAVVLADYDCLNEVSCEGSVLNGAPIDTSTPGPKSITISATDALGNITSRAVEYTVSFGMCVAPYPGLTLWLPGDGTAQDLVSATSATWFGTEAYSAARVAQGFATSGGSFVAFPFVQTGPFTLQAWVRTSNRFQPEGTGIVSTGLPGQRAGSLQIDLDGYGNYRLNVGANELVMLIGPASDLPQHIAVTFDGATTIAVYLNGALVQSETWAGSSNPGVQTLKVGVDTDGALPFDGTVDEVQLFNVVLSAEGQILPAFQAGSFGFCKNDDPLANAAASPNPAEAEDATGAVVTLDGTASTDPDGDQLSYSWYEGATLLGTGDRRAVRLPLGPHTITLVVNDGRGGTASDEVDVLVRDITPPAISNVPEDRTAEALSAAGAPVSWIGPTAVDAVDGPVAVTCVLPSGSTFGLGTTEVTCSASDSRLNTASVHFFVHVVDTTAPLINVPADMIVQAARPDGAVVNYTVSGTDVVDGVVAVQCVPPSGSLFGLTTTTVNCSAKDAPNNTAAASFSVTVVDTIGPVLSLPGPMIAEATGPAGAVVTYSASAFDLVSGPATIGCVPISGSTFAIGTTNVICQAIDTQGNRSSDPFSITVRDTTVPAVQFTSPSADAMPAGATLDLVMQAADVVGVTGVTVNGAAASLQPGGSGLSGQWRATVPIALPVAPGGALRFDAHAADVGGGDGTATLFVDADGIPAAMDRNRLDGSDQSQRFSNDFNNGVTVGTLIRNGWVARLSPAPAAGGVRTTLTGAGGVAIVSACTGSAKEIRLNAAGETADVTCLPATGTATVRSASGQIEFRKQLASLMWQQWVLLTGQSMTAGSPAAASAENTGSIEAQILQVEGGEETVVGAYTLPPGATVDVHSSDGPDGAEIALDVLQGAITVTVSGVKHTVRVGESIRMRAARLPGVMFGGGRVQQGEVAHQFQFRVADQTRRLEPSTFSYSSQEPSAAGRGRAIEHRFEASTVSSVTFTRNLTVTGRGVRPTAADAVEFSGTGRWDGRPGYTFEARAVEGEPNAGPDTFRVTIRDASGAIVSSVDGTVSAGSVQSLPRGPGR